MNLPGARTLRIAAATVLGGITLAALGLAAIATPAGATTVTHEIISETGAHGQTTVVAQCPAGYYVTGGGYNTADAPDPLSVIVDVQDNSGTAWQVHVSSIGTGWMTVSAECTADS
jgi:opacity protein-like surface antigen